MDKKFELIDCEDSVLYVNFQGRKSLFSHTTSVARELTEKIKEGLSYGVSTEEREELFGEGVNCEILKPNASWQKGEIRIALEFCPDEPEVEAIPIGSEPETRQSESPLADIRQMVTENSQQSNL